MFCILGPRRICENAKGVFLGISTCDNNAMKKLNLLSYGCAYDVWELLAGACETAFWRSCGFR